MAYSYEQFESAASKAGLLDKFDQQDLIIARANPDYGISMLKLMQDSSSAKTAEQRVLADEAARQLRQTYGSYVSGGRLPEYADEVIQQTDNQYAQNSAYRKALAQAGGYEDHEIDGTIADIYSSQYAQEGSRAAADALARASAATGGRPSSYAMALARQTENDYREQLQEALYGLRENAYQQALAAAQSPEKSALQEKAETVAAGAGNYFGKLAEKLNENLGPLAFGVSNVVGSAVDKATQLFSQPKPDETERVKEIIDDLDVYIPQWKAQWDDEGVANVLMSHINARIERQGGFTDEEMAAILAYLKKKGYYNG